MSFVMFCCSMKVFAGKRNLTISPPVSMIKIQSQKWARPLLRDKEMKLGHDNFAQTKDNRRTKRNKERIWSNQHAAAALFFIHA
jgi:hypothetical protein